jgi:hypothetical protein
METKQTAMYDFMVHLRLIKNQLLREYQNQRADYYMVRILEGLELKAHGFLTQEKEQLIDAFTSGEHQQGFENEAELFYNETYGK